MRNTPQSDELQPIIPVPAVESEAETKPDEKIDFKLYKSLSYLSDFEFIERDNNGFKMRVKTNFRGDEFPFRIGYVVVSEYDDRQFLVSKIDPENCFLWFGLWEE